VHIYRYLLDDAELMSIVLSSDAMDDVVDTNPVELVDVGVAVMAGSTLIVHASS